MSDDTPGKPSAAMKAARANGIRRSVPPAGDTHDLALGVAPVLHEMCDGRLGEIEWFQSTWQRGGAATGFSTWRFHDGRRSDVIVKLPVGPREHRWTVGLGACDADDWDRTTQLPVPRVVAAGEMLGGYDLGWFVIERLAGPALNQHICEASVVELLQTAATFHRAAAELEPVHGSGEERDWADLLHRSREALEYAHMPEIQRWRTALKKLEKCHHRVLEVWNGRTCDTWCHGDLHLGNAMRRADASDGSPGRCVLLDLAFIHAGHWIEDAVYVERQFWAHPEVLGETRPVSALGRFRRELGLESHGDHTVLAAARRALMAGCAPAWWGTEGTPAYANGALAVLERSVGMFAK